MLRGMNCAPETALRQTRHLAGALEAFSQPTPHRGTGDPNLVQSVPGPPVTEQNSAMPGMEEIKPGVSGMRDASVPMKTKAVITVNISWSLAMHVGERFRSMALSFTIRDVSLLLSGALLTARRPKPNMALILRALCRRG